MPPVQEIAADDYTLHVAKQQLAPDGAAICGTPEL
jgi:hypothetical protein